MTDLDELVKRALIAAAPAVADSLRPVIREEVAAALATPGADELCDIKEVAEKTDSTVKAVYSAMERGTFPLKPVRVGRLLRFRRSDLVALAAGRVRR